MLLTATLLTSLAVLPAAAVPSSLPAPAAPSPAAARQPAGPVDPALAASYFAEARALSDRDGGSLWGEPLYGPMIFVDRATRSVATNHPDRAGRFTPSGVDGVWSGTLPAQLPIANTAVIWGGERWSMVAWPLPADATARGALMMHEAFHRLQTDLGLPALSPTNPHLDSAEGRTWLRLELRALAAALHDASPLESDALGDALTFRAHRQSLFAGSARTERDGELHEGAAEYTGVKLCGADDDAIRHRTVGSLRMYDTARMPLGNTFAYATGPAYGLLLDLARPDWTRQARRRGLARQLVREIRFRAPKPLAEAAALRATTYDADGALAAEERARQQERDDRVARARERFVDGATLIIPLRAGEYSYEYSPYGMESLEGVGTIYRTMRLAGPWGILQARDGVLMVTDDDGPLHIRVPAPARDEVDTPDGPIDGDGWSFELAEGWQLAPAGTKGNFVLRKRR